MIETSKMYYTPKIDTNFNHDVVKKILYLRLIDLITSHFCYQSGTKTNYSLFLLL